MTTKQIGRRGILKAGTALGVGLAAPTVLSIPVRAQTGTRPVRFQLSYIPNNNQLGLVVAQKLGYFEEEKLTLAIQPGGPSIDGIPMVASGAADVGVISSSPSLMLAASQGIPVRAIAVQMQEHPYTYFSLPKAPIRSPKDMVGKRIGIPTTGKVLLSALLKKNGIPESDVKIVPIGSDMAPLLTGQADAVTNWATQVSLVKKLGPDVVHMRLWDWGVKLYGQVIYALDETAEKRPEVLVGFIRAAAKGWKYAYENTEQALDIFVKEYRHAVIEDEREAVPTLFRYMFTENTKKNGWGAFDPAVWQDQIDLFDSLGQFTAAVPKRDQVMTTKILEATNNERPRIG